MKDLEKLMEDFINFESNNLFFKMKVMKVNFWPMIRFDIFRIIQEKKIDVGQAHSNLNEATKIKIVLLRIKQFKYFIFNNPLFIFKQKDILILNHKRRVRENDYYTCLYTDLLIDNLKLSNVVLEEPMLEKHYQPVKHANILYTDYINFIVAIKKRLLKKKLFDIDNEIVINLTNSINKEFDTNFETDELEKIIYNSVISFKYRIKYYKRILKSLKPKVIIEVVSYGMSRYVINHITKELNIPTIELQHGTMGKYHVAYNFKEKIELSTFPDYIFTFGQFWKDNTRFPIKDENIKVVGWPFLENKVSTYQKNINKNNNKTILFISQGTIGKPLSKVAVELRELTMNDYNIIYKLHPGEYDRWKKEYPWLKDSNIEVIDHNNHDMHHYLAKSHVQVGVYSTSLFEGLAYNLSTFILPFFGYSHMEKLINEGLVVLLKDSKDLYEKIENINKNNINISKNEYLWSTNSATKMLTEIDNIIKGNVNDN